MGMFISGSSTSTGSFHELHIADKIGIGTSTPIYALHVDAGNDLVAHFKNAGDRARLYISDEDTSGYMTVQNSKFSIGQANSVSTNNLTILGDGKVGIGSTNPYSALNVRGANTANGNAKRLVAFFDTTSAAAGTGAGISLGGYTNGTGGDINDLGVIQGIKENGTAGNYASALTFQTRANGAGTQEQMRITSTGRVGIGNTAPDVPLHVNGIIRSYGGSGGVHIYGAGFFYLENANRIQWGNTASITSNGQGTLRVYGHTDATKGEVQYGNGGAYIAANGANLGVGTRTASTTLAVNGSFSATSKSFLINHPTKENKKLQYASLEGPENGVYVRGKFQGGKYQDNIIDLPDYWVGLVHDDSITVNLTPVGKYQQLYVEDIKDNQVFIKSADDSEIKCFYTIYGERKDIEKLEVEF